MKQLYRFSFFLAFLISLAAGRNTFAQAGIIRGRVVDGASGKALEYAYILNYSLHKNIYCNIGGEFRLDARPGDTLVMYALGYYYQKVIVDASMLGIQQVKEFQLKQQVYDLTEARILGIGSYEDFRRDFIAMDIPKTRTDNLNEYIGGIARTEAVEAYEKARAEGKLNGITFVSVPILTPEEKERIKLARIIEKEQVRDQIYQKYNPVLVKRVTGLTIDDEIIDFMAFCDFSERYLLNVSEYDLMSRIALKFEMYKRNREDKKRMENHLNRIDDIMDHLV
jgi:hypothetical protein